MPKRPKTRFFTIFFNFFHILGYLEGEFSPTGPRNPILGAGFTRGCPGNGLMVKKTKTGQIFTRESDPLPPPPPLLSSGHSGLVTLSCADTMRLVELTSTTEALNAAACACLSEEWPNVTSAQRAARIIAKGGVSYALVEDMTHGTSSSSHPTSTPPADATCTTVDPNTTSTLLGYARLQKVVDSGEGSSCAVTSVVIPKTRRGEGFGTALMSALEDAALSAGYAYIYLWTSTAKGFYLRCGYMLCDRINLDKPVLRGRGQAVLALEAMLRGRAAGPIEDNPQEGDDVVWMRKRLLERTESILRSEEDLSDLIVQAVARLGSFEYQCKNFPWAKQIGPSCGLAALRMVYEGENGEGGTDGLLTTAVSRGFTNDGEMFRINELRTLSEEHLKMPASVLPTTGTTVLSALQANKLVVLPYDRSPGTSLPALYEGAYAHYGVVIGYGVGKKGDGDGVCDCRRVEEEAVSGVGEGDSLEDVYLIVQHGMSAAPVIAKVELWVQSNHNLFPSERTVNRYKTEESEAKKADLAGKCLVLEGN